LQLEICILAKKQTKKKKTTAFLYINQEFCILKSNKL